MKNAWFSNSLTQFEHGNYSSINHNNPAGNYMFKVNNRNTRARCEICSKLAIKIPERRLASFWYLYCYLLTYFTPCSSVYIVNFEQVNAGWEWNSNNPFQFFQPPKKLHENISHTFIFLQTALSWDAMNKSA